MVSTRTDEGDALGRWLEELSPTLDGLRDFQVPEDFPFDFTPDSLVPLEGLLLDRAPDGARPAPGEDSLLDGMAGYVGETLLRLAGGAWVWDHTSRRPVVQSDPALDPNPALDRSTFSPYGLIGEALRVGDGSVLSTAAGQLQTLVDQRRAEDPDWEPAKEHTPGVDSPVLTTVRQDPWLVEWLSNRETAFGRWVDTYGDQLGPWDFTPGSLDQLESVMLDRVGSVDALGAAEQADLVDGAVWYVGEVALRHGGAVWRYAPVGSDPEAAELAESNPWVGRPYVWQNKPEGKAAIPYGELRATVRARTPGTLRQRFDLFSS